MMATQGYSPCLLGLDFQIPKGVPAYPFLDLGPGTEWRPDLLHPLGIGAIHYFYSDSWWIEDIVSLTVPCWLLLLFCTPCPAYWLYRRLRPRESELPGHCRKCGYDLRAHKAGEKCPECGTVVPAVMVDARRGWQPWRRKALRSF